MVIIVDPVLSARVPLLILRRLIVVYVDGVLCEELQQPPVSALQQRPEVGPGVRQEVLTSERIVGVPVDAHVLREQSALVLVPVRANRLELTVLLKSIYIFKYLFLDLLPFLSTSLCPDFGICLLGVPGDRCIWYSTGAEFLGCCCCCLVSSSSDELLRSYTMRAISSSSETPE